MKWVGKCSFFFIILEYKSLKVENVYWLSQREMRWKKKKERFKAWEWLNLLLLALKEDRDMSQKMQEMVLSWKWKLTASKATGISVLQPQGTNSANNLNKQENGPFRRASRKECSPADILILACWDPYQNTDLQNCKIINLCCFKPLSLCWFVTAAVEN